MDDDILIEIMNRIEDIHDYITLIEQSKYELDNCEDFFYIEKRLRDLKNRISDL